MIYTCDSVTSDTLSNELLQKLELFVSNQQNEHHDHPAVINMGHNPYTGLLWNIQKQHRWQSAQGSIAILLHSDKIVGLSCVELSDEYKNFNITIGGVRCWLDKRHRTENQVTKYLLSQNLSWSIKQKADAMMLTFNDYNKIIYDTIRNKTQGRAAGLGKIWSSWWNNCICISRPLIVRNTAQWCVLKPINELVTLQIAKELEYD